MMRGLEAGGNGGVEDDFIGFLHRDVDDREAVVAAVAVAATFPRARDAIAILPAIAPQEGPRPPVERLDLPECERFGVATPELALLDVVVVEVADIAGVHRQDQREIDGRGAEVLDGLAAALVVLLGAAVLVEDDQP